MDNPRTTVETEHKMKTCHGKKECATEDVLFLRSHGMRVCVLTERTGLCKNANILTMYDYILITNLMH